MKKTLINNNYVKLISATFITRFGDAVESIALSWLVYVMTGSKLLMGTLFAVSMIPNLITLPFAGVLADTYDKKKITVISDFARGISVSVMAFFYYFNILEVWHLFMFVIINSFFESFANPARGSMLPSIIKKDEYVKGSAYLTTSTTLGELIGVSVAGILIATIGAWGAILVDGITFFLSAVIILIIKYKDRNESQEKFSAKNISKSFVLIKGGFKYVVKSRILFSLVLLSAFINFSFVPFNVLRPVYVDEILHMGANGMSYLGMAILVGMLIGGVIYGKIGHKLHPIKVLAVCLSIVSLNNALMGTVEIFEFTLINALIYAMIVSFFIGFFIAVIQSSLRAMIMKTTAPEMMGRLSSILAVIALCAMPIGGALVGFVGDYIRVTNLFIIMGVCGFVVSVLFGVTNRKSEIEANS